MQTFDPATLAKLASGRIVKRDMLLFSFPSGFYGFWTGGKGKLTYQGVDYIGAAHLIKLEALAGSVGMAALAIQATMTAIPGTELSPNVLTTIEAEQWHQSPVVISRAYIDPDTRELLSVERMFRGYFDTLDHDETLATDEQEGSYTLTASFESKARDHLKTGYRMRGDADQRRINANDASLRYVSTAGQQEISWGRVSKKKAGAAHG